MYNRVDASENATIDRLSRRTRAFVDADIDVGDASSLAAFRARWEQVGADKKLLSGLPNCPFLGLIDRPCADPEGVGGGRVGCLVHPLQNDGVDGRDCGVYDQQTCQRYLCASHDVLKDHEKLLVIQAVDDSYLYGLVITDVCFIRELLALAAEQNGMAPPARCLQRPEAIDAARAYFELKRDWSFGGHDAVFGQVEPGTGLETSRRQGPSERLGVAADSYEAMLRCLGTAVESVDQLDEARRAVARRVDAFARAVAL